MFWITQALTPTPREILTCRAPSPRHSFLEESSERCLDLTTKGSTVKFSVALKCWHCVSLVFILSPSFGAWVFVAHKTLLMPVTENPFPHQDMAMSHELSCHLTFSHPVTGGIIKERTACRKDRSTRLLIQWPCELDEAFVSKKCLGCLYFEICMGNFALQTP